MRSLTPPALLQARLDVDTLVPEASTRKGARRLAVRAETVATLFLRVGDGALDDGVGGRLGSGVDAAFSASGFLADEAVGALRGEERGMSTMATSQGREKRTNVVLRADGVHSAAVVVLLLPVVRTVHVIRDDQPGRERRPLLALPIVRDALARRMVDFGARVVVEGRRRGGDGEGGAEKGEGEGEKEGGTHRRSRARKREIAVRRLLLERKRRGRRRRRGKVDDGIGRRKGRASCQEPHQDGAKSSKEKWDAPSSSFSIERCRPARVEQCSSDILPPAV